MTTDVPNKKQDEEYDLVDVDQLKDEIEHDIKDVILTAIKDDISKNDMSKNTCIINIIQLLLSILDVLKDELRLKYSSSEEIAISALKTVLKTKMM